MAALESAPVPLPARRERRVGSALARAWDARPEWARDRAVLGLAGSLLALLVLFFLALGYLRADQPGRHLTLDQLDRLARARRIAVLELRDQDAVAVGRTRRGTRFSVAYPASDAVTADVIRRVSRAGARVSVDEQSGKQAIRTATTFLLPLVILANL